MLIKPQSKSKIKTKSKNWLQDLGQNLGLRMSLTVWDRTWGLDQDVSSFELDIKQKSKMPGLEFGFALLDSRFSKNVW